MHFFMRDQQIGGRLGYFGLGDWWLSTFSEQERRYIDNAYSYFGTDQSNLLTQGDISSTSETIADVLNGIIGTLRDCPQYIHLIRPIVIEAEELASGDALGLHFLYQNALQIAYRHRQADPLALDVSVEMCEKQVAIAPQAAREFKRQISAGEAYRTLGARLPAHIGYKQLAIILEKRKDYEGALRLVSMAKKQGWAGDWDKRAEKLQRRIEGGRQK